MINPILLRRLFRVAGSCGVFAVAVVARAALPEIVVTNDLVLEPGAQLATGWPRSVAGLQSLLSIYLLALWVLTYFGRPFD